MCGRFTLTSPDGALVQFNLPGLPALEPRYNIAPTQPVAVVRMAAQDASRELVLLKWGLIPYWAKDPSLGARLINARCETVAQKPAFRDAFRKRRCLVVADGFFEWQKQNGGKQPFYIRLREGGLFGMAGLWEAWRGAEGVIESCTLITTNANDLMRPIHDRMPVILEPRDYDLWLERGLRQGELLLPLLRPLPSEEMIAYPVSRRVNSPENDDPHCIEPLVHGQSSSLPGM
ncbi:MAG TPA: SOS response-associated peptidase [Anaerolineae bacterium]|nr:SOS response-associated peptidase [Anaerolineae bacterium]